MDHLRSNLAGYYTPQQYTPVPLPAYPPPTAFSNPSPYSRNELHHSFHQGFDPTLAHPQNVARLQAVAANAGPATALESVDEDTNLDESIDIAIEVAKRKTKSGSAAKGFPRTSAVYQIDRDGTKRRVVAEDFRAEVEERTRSGESCEAIADALIAQGVQVTSKSISRWRILWGFRKRVRSPF